MSVTTSAHEQDARARHLHLGLHLLDGTDPLQALVRLDVPLRRIAGRRVL
jgi:hypothetical protein